jgi:DNA polymerase-3 subunit beta
VLEVYSVNDIIGKNNYRVPVSTEGKKEEIKISFNWRYILDGLKIYENNEVVLGFNNSEKPVVVRDKKEKRVVYIVMPIRSATP